MGDLNAKVGNDNTNHGKVMGKEGYGSMNNNVERLLEFCTAYDLVIRGTLFSQHEIHKLIWCSPDGRDKKQIDHREMERIVARCQCQKLRGADIGRTTILASPKLKLSRNGPGMARKQQFELLKSKGT